MSKTVDMCNGKMLPNILRFTFPIILTSILQLLFNTADLVVVGQFGSEYSVAAVGATGSLVNLIVNLFVGFSVGAGVGVAYNIGAGNYNGVYRMVHTAIPTAIISGTVVTVIGFFFSETFLSLMGTPDDIIDLSTLYLKIYFLGMIPSMIFNFGAAILRAAGNTKGPLYYLTAAGALNVILNLVFVIICNMDVAGVALATTISQFVSGGLVVFALINNNSACRLIVREMHIYKEELKSIVSVGLPAGIQSSLFSISNVIIQSSINSFGADAVSGCSSATSIEAFVYASMNAFHQTSINFIGQNMGARKYNRIKTILFMCLTSVTVIGLVLGNIVVFFGKPLLSIYLGDSTEKIAYGLTKLSVLCPTYFLCGWMDTMTGALRGMGSSKTPMFITVFGACISRIIWIFTIFRIERFHSLEWLFISYPISWALTVVAEFIAFIIIYRIKKKGEAQRSEAQA